MDGFQRRREQKKRSILAAALALFMEYGPQKVSMTEIAARAHVSQVTIYKYFGNKHHLIQEVIIDYIDQVWHEYEQLLQSETPFPEKIKQIIFDKKETAQQIHEDFYEYLMKEYTTEGNYMEKIYSQKALPLFIDLFNQGKEEGYMDPDLSNEVILFYIQMFKEYMQREDVYQQALPMTEDLTRIFFYGIVGKREE